MTSCFLTHNGRVQILWFFGHVRSMTRRADVGACPPWSPPAPPKAGKPQAEWGHEKK